MDSPLDTTPCPKCQGKGYIICDKLVKTTKVCACINENLPIPEIKDGKLNFILN
jgi:hypothetical protein